MTNMTLTKIIEENIKLMEQYKEMFGEGFARFQAPQMSEAKLMETLRHCIETKTPYQYPELPEGCLA